MSKLLIANKYGTVISDVQKAMGDATTSAFFRPLYLSMKNSELTEPYRQHVWTYSCVNAIATALKSVPFVIVREGSDSTTKRKNFSARQELQKIRSLPPHLRYKVGIDELISRGFEVVESGDAFETFNRPNPLMTLSQMWEAWAILMNMNGGIFWILDGGEDGAVGETEWPKEIWPWAPEQFEQDIDKDNGNLLGWKFRPSGASKERTLKPHQVLWFRYFNPYETFKGLAPFEVVRRAASQDIKAQSFNEAFFDNGAAPGGFLKIKESISDPNKRKAIMTKFNDEHQGHENAGKWGLVMNDASIEWNPTSHNDMQYLDGRGWNRDETFAGFGVPKMLGSIYEDLQLATALVAEKMFWTNKVIPNMHYIEDVINSRLFNNSRIKETRGLYCLFDISGVEALRADLASKAETADKLCRIGATWNEVNERLQLGFEPKEWGNTWYKPISMVDVTDEDLQGDEGESGKKQDKPEANSANDENKKGSVADAMLSNLVIKTGAFMRAQEKEKRTKMWIERVFRPIEKPFQSKISRYWYELRQEQLRKWNEATKAILRGVPSGDELQNILFDSKQWKDMLKTVSKPFINSAAQYSAEHIADELGTTYWGMEDPRIVAVLDTKMNKIVGITDTFWNHLKSTLTEGINKGENVTELSERIRGSFNNVQKSSRTLTIARTETAQTASTVRNQVMKAEGIEKKEWSDSGDEHVRGDHVILGKTGEQPMNHNYLIDLSRSDGKLLHPSDMSGPADQVINCRCLELPVI
jgi:HK97 family phage portal protein